MNNKQQLATQIAEQIEVMLQSKRVLARTNAPIQPRDILVLMQTRTNVDFLLQQLASRHIPNTGIDRLRLNQHIAVLDMLALMQFLCNHNDDMSLACALLSPIFNLNHNDLTEICYNRINSKQVTQERANSLFAYIAEHNRELHQQLQDLIELAQTHLMPSHFITHILYGEGYMAHFIARLGEVAQEILQYMISQAQNYEHAHIAPNLYDFVSWLKQLESDIKLDSDSGGNKVRIMTVHGAKGLESPIVILADSHAPPNVKENIIIYEDKANEHNGQIPIILAMNGGKEKHFGIFAQAKQQYDAVRYEEYWRLLYVAITRAADELHIFGSGKKLEKKTDEAKTWYDKIFAAMSELPNVVTYENGMMQYSPHENDNHNHQIEGDLGDDASVSRETFLPHNLVSGDDAMSPSTFTLPPQFNLPTAPPPMRFKAVTSLRGQSLSADNIEVNYINNLLPNNYVNTTLPAKLKGELIHALLERQVNMRYADFLCAAPNILPHVAKAYGVELSQAQIVEVLQPFEVIANDAILVELLELPAFAELPMLGKIGLGKIGKDALSSQVALSAQIVPSSQIALSSQIDRVIINADNIHIIDFKTGEHANDDGYANMHQLQLGAYQAMLSNLYPNHHIITSLFYVI